MDRLSWAAGIELGQVFFVAIVPRLPYFYVLNFILRHGGLGDRCSVLDCEE